MIFLQKMRGISEMHLSVQTIRTCKKVFTKPQSIFKAGDTFLLKRTPEQDDFYHLMNGKFCGAAWDAISRYVYAALQGGSIMRKWTNDDRLTTSGLIN